MLASHGDRENTIGRLQNAFLAGQLNDSELEERVVQALQARTETELATITNDFLTEPVSLQVHKVESAIAVFSGIEKKGTFTISQFFKSVAVFGGCTLDLRAAKFSSPVTQINIVAVLGGVEVIVPSGVRVFLHQLPILGGISSTLLSEELPANAPAIHIHALAVLGGIGIRSS